MKGSPRRAIDGGMVWAIFLSLAAHVTLLLVILVAPIRAPSVPVRAIESYTVELISPDVLGGNSGPIAPGSEPESIAGDEAAADDAAADDAAPPDQVEPAAAEPIEDSGDAVAEGEQHAGPDEAVTEPAAVVEDLDPALAPGTEEPPAAVAEAEEAVAERADAPGEVQGIAAEDMEQAPQETSSEGAVEDVVEGVAEDIVEEVAAAKKEELVRPGEDPRETPMAPATVVPDKDKSTTPPRTIRPTKRPSTPDLVAQRDRRIAEAVGRRAAAADDSARIAAAVQRRAEQVDAARAGGSGIEGPLSSGPGSGAGGGVVRGTEYILYKRRMESRIRDSWVWVGHDDRLEAVIRFTVAADGEVADVRTTRPSGDPAYDASAERAVRAANPLGMVPPAYRREFADVEMTFRARDLPRNLRR